MSKHRVSRRVHEHGARGLAAAAVAAVSIGALSAGTVGASAQGAPRACAKLVAGGKAQLGRFEASAARLVLAASGRECRERIAELVQAVDGMDRAFDELQAGKCQVDRRLEPGERRQAGESIRRWEAGCARLDEAAQVPAGPPVQAEAAASDAPQPPAQAAPPPARSRPVAQYSTLAMVFLSLLALVVLSVFIGRLSARPKARVMARVPDAHAASSGSRGAAASPATVETINLLPDKGGPAFPVEAWRLDGPGILVGRDPDLCDVVVPDKHISSRHARIWRDKNGVHIQDLGSANGVWREGKRVSRCTIVGGEAIQIGETTFRLALSRA